MRAFITAILVLAAAVSTSSYPVDPISGNWVTSWASAQQLSETANRPPITLEGATLRQYIQTTTGGSLIRLVLSNAFGEAPVTFETINVAYAVGNKTGDGLIVSNSSRALKFRGSEKVTIQPGATVVSDSFQFTVKPMSNLAITSFTSTMPYNVTGHPGSRTTSFMTPGNYVKSADLSNATQTNHWYYISSLQILSPEKSFSIAILGDSLTDGRGSTTNGNDRWPNVLAARLQANRNKKHIAVINQAAGGGRLLRHGLGQSGISRIDNDVIAQPGVQYLMVFEGINDIGTAVGPRASNASADSFATAKDIIDGYDQIVTRCHAKGIVVIGCTLLPFGGNTNYDTPSSEADRVAVNNWIRTSDRFDYVVDFEKVVRDPKNVTYLLPSIDTGDHLHLNPQGYKMMADSIDLDMFE
ncbi:hypothetical protein HK098_002287 [Nowakowskiella sp. JEL0407]|nr:hypothetical protein HK098_002287 [Nowakowskiella sp. JEL0407]